MAIKHLERALQVFIISVRFSTRKLTLMTQNKIQSHCQQEAGLWLEREAIYKLAKQFGLTHERTFGQPIEYLSGA